MVNTYGQVYQDIRGILQNVEDPQSAGRIARDLICHATGKTPEYILTNRDETISDPVCDRLEAELRRYLGGEPLAYILEEWEFYGLPLYVNPDVLIPRDDTCAVAALAISRGLFLDQDPRILDLCCGSGCIGLAVASRVKDARITLADLSKEALAIAKKNIQRNHLGGRVSCMQVNAMKPVPAFLGKFDMIVSNPPYITGPEMQELPESVIAYEPHMALYGGEDGLDFYRGIVRNFTACLKPGGFLCFEFGMGQGDDVCRILEENGYTVLERTRDFNDRERAVLAQYGRKDN